MTKAKQRTLKVTATAYPKQFWVQGRSSCKGSFDDTYVAFSGFFGEYGPNVFAAAPELLEALIYLRDCAESGELPRPKRWAQVQAAIKQAAGG